MNRPSIFLPIALLAILGCSGEPDLTESPAPDSTTTSQTDGAATTFVSLKVPNMV
ncbi:MAG: hypothetical protein AAF497_27110 [Planctomycetota bacterium]